MTRVRVVLGPALILAVGLIAVLIGLTVSGGAAAPIALDPGPVVRWGLPIVRMLADLAAGVTLGTLLLAVVALSPREPEFGRALDLVAAAAAVWTVVAATSGLLAFSSVTALAPSLEPEYGDALGAFLTGSDLGRAWLTTTLLAALVTVIAFAVRNVTALGLTVVGIALGLIPLAEQGHAGGTADHNIAITAMWLHLLFAGIWVGGLVALAVLRPTLPPGRLAAVLPRYSSLALVSFVVVAVSGFASAVIRVTNLEQLGSGYGVLVVVKVLALLGLGVFGAIQRRALIGRLVDGGRAALFAALVAGEIAVMGIASGVAAALGVSAPPEPQVPATALPDPTPAELLTGAPLPPELTPSAWVTQWEVDLLWLLVVAFGTAFYLLGVWRLHRRGDRWPVYRTLLWVAGMALLLWSTNGVLAAYQEYLFSMHMLEHMLLTMAVPVLLVPAAPVTLALRAIRRREDGSRGPREWILVLTHSRLARVLTNPIVAAALFALSLWAFYYSPLLRWAMADHVGHEWMVLHFLITGYLFAQVLVGTDPVGNRPSYPLRLILLLATMGFHAFFGIAIMSSDALFAADWYGAMGRTWGLPPLEDQRWGGGIAWSVGEIPTVALAIAVVIMWSRSDDREAKRRDRAADRDGDAELEAYNAMLAARATADARAGRE
ncbi:MAG: bifunctional copper resistance protein CopD/cytochrome c oxidase assembly protein [Actinomycetales bacterium]|nr:bifunctional copper resistance protein CopD/cytochrome c oxidase assembly protein [Actinomycetales bacterium]